MSSFSYGRFLAIAKKEFIQMRRDRLTFAMMVGIPIMQLVIFGYAINSDPKDLPTAVYSTEVSPFSRSVVAALKATDYFQIVAEPRTETEARELINRGDVLFLVQFPTDFARKVVRGENPSILVDADATDPMSAQNALAAVTQLATTAINRDLKGPLSNLQAEMGPMSAVLHRSFNPEGLSQWNIVPGLLGLVLTMTMIIITAVAVTRERERGTMENLLATPAQPLEVMTGKILPYILVGYVQVLLILVAAHFLFHVPMIGSISLLLLSALLFIVANLSVGILFSTIARNQLQAVQMAFFFFLPSILLSGFMFPFRGMPDWAQAIGSILPLTHFLRVIRGILLKGNGPLEILPHLVPILLFTIATVAIGARRYRQTLD